MIPLHNKFSYAKATSPTRCGLLVLALDQKEGVILSECRRKKNERVILSKRASERFRGPKERPVPFGVGSGVVSEESAFGFRNSIIFEISHRSRPAIPLCLCNTRESRDPGHRPRPVRRASMTSPLTASQRSGPTSSPRGKEPSKINSVSRSKAKRIASRLS